MTSGAVNNPWVHIGAPNDSALVEGDPVVLTVSQVRSISDSFPADGSGVVVNPYIGDPAESRSLSIYPGATAAQINAAVTELFGTLASPTLGGEVVFHPGTHTLEASVFLPFKVSAKFMPGAKIVPAADAVFTGDFVFLINSLDGEDWNLSYTNIYGAVFEGCYVDNSATPDLVVKMVCAGAPHSFLNLRGNYLSGLVHSVSSYFDKFHVEGFHSINAQGDQYQIWLRSLGDGVVIKRGAVNTPSSSTTDDALAIQLNGCQGGIIDSVIQGRIYLARCRSISVRGKHGERQGQVEFYNSDGVIDSCYFWRKSTPRILITGDEDNYRSVKVRDCLFLHNFSYEEVRAEFDIQTRDRVELTIENTYAGITANDNINYTGLHGPQISNVPVSTGVVTALDAFNDYAYQLARRCIIYRGRILDGFFPMDVGSGNVSPGFAEAYNSDKVTWGESSGTYYYQAAQIWDPVRMLGKVYETAERSATKTNGSAGVWIPYTGFTRGLTAILRVYRGTSPGVYNKYVDIHYINFGDIHDEGFALNGCVWLDRTPGAVDSFDSVSALELSPTGRAVMRRSTPPSIGPFQAGDRCQAFTISTGNPASWVYTGTGWEVETTLADKDILVPIAWSARPDATTCAGKIIAISDITTYPRFVSDGTSWRPLGGRQLLRQLSSEWTSAAVPDSSLQVVNTFSIPAGMVIAGSELVVELSAEKIGGTSDTATVRLRIDNQNVFTGALATTDISGGTVQSYKRVSATSMRKVGAGASSEWGSLAAKSTAARAAAVTVSDMDANATSVQLSVQMTTGTTETASIGHYRCWLAG